MDAKPYKIPHPFRKLNKKLIDKLVEDIGAGCNHKYTAESNGITEAIFSIWRRQGAIDIHENLDTLPAYLVKSLAEVKKLEVIECRNAIRNNEKGHKGAEWTLEHAYWQDYSSSAAVIAFQKQLDEMDISRQSKDDLQNEIKDINKK